MKSWNELSTKEQNKFLKSWKPNGCWAKGSWLRPPYWIFFAASCCIHDWWYTFWENEDDRKQADIGLLKYMKKDVQKIENPPTRAYYYVWCYLYYFALRMFWEKAFYANKQK